MWRVGGFLTCNDWNVENIWQLTCVKPIPDRYDFYCMPFVFRHIVRSPCYQQQGFTLQFSCRLLQGFQFTFTGLGVRDIIRHLYQTRNLVPALEYKINLCVIFCVVIEQGIVACDQYRKMQ